MSLIGQKLESATVRWFDSTKGEGLVRLKSGESVYLHFSAIQGWGKNNYVCPAEVDQVKSIKGKECLVAITRDSHYNQVNFLTFEV